MPLRKIPERKEKNTPLMEQYYRIKAQVPDALLLYRMGDFFELFDEDARIASEVLGITLTKRSHGMEQPTPLAGVPYHALDKYLTKLLSAGFKVAICEQVEDPKKAKGLVARDLIEIMTPGTATIETGDSPESSFILSASISKDGVSIAVADLLAGEFFVKTLKHERVLQEIELIGPKEILIAENIEIDFLEGLKNAVPSAKISLFEPWKFGTDFARDTLKSHFGVDSLDGFGEMSDSEISSAGALIAYFRDLRKGDMAHIRSISVERAGDAMMFDPATVRNLEIVRSIAEGTTEGSFLWIIDLTCTPMGHRFLRDWLLAPLIEVNAIVKRQSAVGMLLEKPLELAKLRELLVKIGDLERLVGKLGNEKANPRDLIALKAGFEEVPKIKDILREFKTPFLQDILENLDPMDDVREIIGKNIVEEPPMNLEQGGIIANGVSKELDELREIRFGGKEYLERLQERLRTELDIPKLKIGYNRVFGYYIEVSRVQSQKMPENFERKQTLINCERYITAELKEYEQKVLSAEERIFELERELFLTIRAHLAKSASRMLDVARELAKLDVIQSLAEIARRENWVRPEFTEEDVIEIIEGRHPVVERLLGKKVFVPNDTRLNSEDCQIILITGPNMSGKSTYLRQVALIVLLAQVGGFVPARKCRLKPIDRIFTRVGAMDNIARGQSTFLVEMIEAANILNNATPNSLVLLDEVGRGTSTFDGLSIAWAIAEFLHENPVHRAKTIFATHYHELTELANIYRRIRNYQVSVRERGDTIEFLHRIVPGGCDDSYGIYVAKLAGVPESVIGRAKQVLSALEMGMALKPETITQIGTHKGKTIRAEGVQISMFEPEYHPIVQELRGIDIDRLSPLDALDAIVRWRKKWIK